jgi:hypothetical protein
VLSEALWLVVKPLSYIFVLVSAFPDTITVFHSLPELSFILLSVHPGVFSTALNFSHVVLADESVSICEYLSTFAVTLIIEPLSLVDSVGVVNNCSSTMPVVRCIIYLTFKN